MAREISYCVSGGCGSTIFFGLTDDGAMYADLGGDEYKNEEDLERFAEDCGVTLEKIRSELEAKSAPKPLRTSTKRNQRPKKRVC